MPSIADLNLDNTPDLETKPDGEYAVEVVKAVATLSKKEAPMVKVTLKMSEFDDAYPMNEYLNLPLSDQEKTMQDMRRRAIKDFCRGVGIDFDTFESEISTAFAERETTGEDAEIPAFVGSRGQAVVRTENYEGRESNKISRWI